MSNRKPVLVCATGMSPQVVTETLQELLLREPAFLPEEVHCITTGDGAPYVEDAFTGSGNHLEALYQQYAPDESPPRLVVHVFKDGDGNQIPDVVTAEDNEGFADHVMDVIRELAGDENSVIHASVSGGRKTMSVHLANAMSCLGRSHDEMSHVIVNPPFEFRSDFFFKPKEPFTFEDEKGREYSTDDADITLAPVPFVPLRESHPHVIEKLTSVDKPISYARVVNQIRSADKPVRLSITLDPYDRPTNVIECNDTRFSFKSLKHLVLYTWIAERAQVDADPVCLATDPQPTAREILNVLEKAELDSRKILASFKKRLEDAAAGKNLDSFIEASYSDFSRMRSEIQSNLVGLATLFLPVSEGRPAEMHLPIEPDNIEIHWRI
ncbi:CRISPR-associated ring nuclease Csm6 [Gammaproteobacteria bacterium AB-CW1]|uniref:CRISPR-associated ring nuclease Csm6 n=1 Tax=Natronospira elongata TaxID=3110268 RepID=A0AAP6MK98_9GAMM|nr:CRISPR-associated ring nuclease Csm6 [Gammaproteobacteria bacterium AB-CW1]